MGGEVWPAPGHVVSGGRLGTGLWLCGMQHVQGSPLPLAGEHGGEWLLCCLLSQHLDFSLEDVGLKPLEVAGKLNGLCKAHKFYRIP